MKRTMTTAAMMLMAVVVFAQSNNVFWSLSVRPKMDKWLDYEKKAVTYIKTHHPNLKYRCWSVISGENSGNFIFVMGPKTWKEIGTPSTSPKGEAADKLDSQGLDMLTETSTATYMTRQDDISNLRQDRKLKFLAVTTYQIEIGSWDYFRDYLKRVKEARAKIGSKSDVDIFRPSASGTGNAFSIVRFMESMEEMDLNEDIEEVYNKANGDGALDRDIALIRSKIKSMTSELRVLRTDMSSM